MFLGREQFHCPDYGFLEKAYILMAGIPIIGLRIRARNIFSLIPARQRFGRILDAGSGTGVITFGLAARYPKARVTGIDCLAHAVASGRAIAEKTGVRNVKFLLKRLEELEADHKYDLIVCVDILEHIEDDQGALRHLFKLADKGGALVLHVPALYRRYPVWKRRVNFDVPTHVRPGYEPEEIVRKVTAAGFKIRHCGFTYGFWETLVNNVGYMITGAKMKNRVLYALVFPILYFLSWLGPRARPERLGAGVYVVADKPGR